MVAELELCAGTIQHASLPELIRIAGKTGFAAVTTNPVHFTGAGMATAELRQLLADNGVRVTNVDGFGSGLPGLPTGAAREAFRDYHGRDVRRTFTTPESDFYRTAHALGGDSINLVHFAGDPATSRQALIDGLGGAAERAAAEGLRIVVEFLPGTGIPSLGVAAELIKATGADNLKITLDPRHLARSDGQPSDVVAVVDLVGLLQMNDLCAATRDDPNRLLPGDGDLPLAEILRPVRDAHPTLPVGIEVFNAALDRMAPIDAAAAAAASLRRLLAETGDASPS